VVVVYADFAAASSQVALPLHTLAVPRQHTLAPVAAAHVASYAAAHLEPQGWVKAQCAQKQAAVQIASTDSH
jgi:hypothetical protein